MNRYDRYPGDYLRDTADLTLAEHGVYCLLLDWCYASEKPVPKGVLDVSFLVRARTDDDRAAVASVLDRFFPIGPDGERHNARVDRDLPIAIKRIEAYRARSLAGNTARWGAKTGSEKDSSMESQKESPPSPSPSNYKNNTTPSAARGGWLTSFSRFWDAYPPTKRKVAKAACHAKWIAMRIGDEDAAKIVEHLKAMAQTEQWRDGYIPAPLTYLNQKRWLDGLPEDPKPARRVAV